MVCQFLSWWEAAPAVGVSAVICLASFVGWSNSLVKKDQMEVCLLSRGACFVSYPSHYRMAFACSILLCPQSHRQPLRTAFPLAGRLRVYHVLITYHVLGKVQSVGER